MIKNDKGTDLFQLIDPKKFDACAKKWEMDKGVRSFTTREMTRTLINSMVLRLETYREVEMSHGVSDSTFGDAMRNRSCGFFEELCDLILQDIRSRTENRKIKRALRR